MARCPRRDSQCGRIATEHFEAQLRENHFFLGEGLEGARPQSSAVGVAFGDVRRHSTADMPARVNASSAFPS